MTAAIHDDIWEKAREVAAFISSPDLPDNSDINAIATAILAERNRATEAYAFVDWVETWVSNPVGAYSVHALDGLFGMARDRIASIRNPTGE